METEVIGASNLPHVANYLDQQLAASDQRSVEAKIGDIMDRTSGMPNYPEGKEAARAFEAARLESPETQNHRALDDDGGGAPEAPDVNAMLDRLFGGDEPEAPADQRPQPQTPPPQPEAQDWRAEPDSSDAALFSMSDAETYAQYEIGLQRLNDDIARFNEQAAQLLQQSNPSNEAENRQLIARYQQELGQRAAALERVGQQIEGAVQGRMKSRFERHVATESAKFHSAVPGADTAKLRSYLSKQGFTERDIATAHDHRLLVAFEKARRYDEQKQQQKPRQAIRKVMPGERSRNDKAILKRADRTQQYDKPSTKDALDRRLSEIFR